jgi:hypothetical protein
MHAAARRTKPHNGALKRSVRTAAGAETQQPTSTSTITPPSRDDVFQLTATGNETQQPTTTKTNTPLSRSDVGTAAVNESQQPTTI